MEKDERELNKIKNIYIHAYLTAGIQSMRTYIKAMLFEDMGLHNYPNANKYMGTNSYHS